LRHLRFASLFSFTTLTAPLQSTLFPYTTLFRSPDDLVRRPGAGLRPRGPDRRSVRRVQEVAGRRTAHGRRPVRRAGVSGAAAARSEEHTSELQSRENIVCRLLLEIKNYY